MAVCKIDWASASTRPDHRGGSTVVAPLRGKGDTAWAYEFERALEERRYEVRAGYWRDIEFDESEIRIAGVATGSGKGLREFLDDRVEVANQHSEERNRGLEREDARAARHEQEQTAEADELLRELREVWLALSWRSPRVEIEGYPRCDVAEKHTIIWDPPPELEWRHRGVVKLKAKMTGGPPTDNWRWSFQHVLARHAGAATWGLPEVRTDEIWVDEVPKQNLLDLKGFLDRTVAETNADVARAEADRPIKQAKAEKQKRQQQDELIELRESLREPPSGH
jgi:hypothetical protein